MPESFPDDPKPFTVLSSHYLFEKPPWLVMRQDRLQVPGKGIIDSYWVWEYPAWVNVIAVTPDEHIVLIRQYRYALGKVNYELPAGSVDQGELDLESAARRELLEETGYGGGSWSLFMTLSANPALQTNLVYTFLAENVSRVQSQSLEATEDIRVHLISAREIFNLIQTEGIIQALHTAPLLKWLLKRKEDGQTS